MTGLTIVKMRAAELQVSDAMEMLRMQTRIVEV